MAFNFAWLKKAFSNLTSIFSPRTARTKTARLGQSSSSDFRRVKPAEFERLVNPKTGAKYTLAEARKERRYAPKDAKRIRSKDETISVRQFQQKQLTEASPTGERISVEQRRAEYKIGARSYATPGQKRAARARSVKAEVSRTFVKMRPEDQRDLAEIALRRKPGERMSHEDNARLGEIMYDAGDTNQARAEILDFLGSPDVLMKAA
jgi:hypothetical protein